MKTVHLFGMQVIDQKLISIQGIQVGTRMDDRLGPNTNTIWLDLTGVAGETQGVKAQWPPLIWPKPAGHTFCLWAQLGDGALSGASPNIIIGSSKPEISASNVVSNIKALTGG